MRVSTLHWENRLGEDASAKLVARHVQQNEGAVLIKMERFDCAHYKVITEDQGGELVMYYWVFGKDNHLFICTFTTDKQQELDKTSLLEVEGIIRSIRIYEGGGLNNLLDALHKNII